MDFYVYVWRRPDGRPFYVGKGRNGRDRMTKNNRIFRNILGKIIEAGDVPTIERIHDGLSEEDALAKEMQLIAQYGRIDNGTGILSNLTDGGEGTTGSKRDERARGNIAKARLAIQRGESMYRGVSFRSGSGLWVAQITAKGKTKNLGLFASAEDAALAYDAAAFETWGEAATLNFPDRVGEVLPSSRTKQEARRLSGPKRGSYKGVSYRKAAGKYTSQIIVDGKFTHLGFYKDEEGAARAYDRAAFAAWGLDCYLNFPEQLDKFVEQEKI